MAAWNNAALASLALLAFAPTPARAQEADPHALAVQLFEEAGRAQDRGAFDEACPEFAKVVELEPAKVGAKLALADCYEQAGKLASAVVAYRAAGARAAELGDPRKKLADDKASALEATAPRLTIQVNDALKSLPGLTVLRDGEALHASQLNRAMLSDPGEHAIYVGALGKKPWSGKVMVLAGASAQLVIGGLEDLSPLVPAAPPMPLSPPSVTLGPRTPSRSVPVWAWATAALGLASGGAAIAFGVDQAATQTAFSAHCKDLPRDEVACGARSARLYRDFGLWIGFGAAGVAGLTAATIGIATSPRRRAPTLANEPARASFWFAPRGFGAALYGRF